jgi:hypothetical protein
MRGLSQLERAEPKSTAAPAVSTADTSAPSRAGRARRRQTAARSTPAWGTRQRLIFTGALITVLGVGLLVFLYIRRPQLPEVDELTPLGTWRLWRDLRHGLDWRPVWEEDYLEKVADNRRWMIVAATIAVLGVLTMGGSLLVSKRPAQRRARKPPPRQRPPRPKKPT